MKILSKQRIQKHHMDPNRFEVVTTERPLTRAEQDALQTEMGFSPMGYGLGDLHKHLNDDGTYLNFWYCSHTCD